MTVYNNNRDGKWEIVKNADADSYTVTYYERYDACGWKQIGAAETYSKECAEYEFDINLDETETADETKAAPQEATNEPEADATETPDEYAEARKLRARAYELRLRAENLNNEGKLHDDFVRYVAKLELQASKAVSRAYVAKNPRLAAALEKAKAKQAKHNATEAADKPATNNKEEPKMTTLLDVHTMNLSATEDEEIFSVKVLWNGGDSWIEYADTAEAMNEWGAHKAVSAWEIDNGTLNVWLAQPAQEAPDAGEPDAPEVVRILGGTLNLIEDNGDEVEAMKARVALWEQVDEFKRRGVALNVEYDADGRFVDVRERKAEDSGAGRPAPQEADIPAMAGNLSFLYAKHNEMMERAHDAERDSAEETDCLKSGDRLYKAIRNAEARLRDAGAEVRRTDGDYPYYHITGAVVKLDGRIVAAYPAENAAGKYVVTGQCRRDLAHCETREEAETVKEKIGGYDIIPVEDYEPPEEDCDCAAWDFSRERIEELAAVVAGDVNDPDPEREWDFDSIGALLAIAGFYGEREDAKMDACKSPEELDALLMEELREAERICNVKIFSDAPQATAAA